MRDTFNKYGKRLTREEYEKRVSENFHAHLDEYNNGDERAYRKAEFNLGIDRHLGVEYPQDKREILYQANERAARKFLRNPLTLLKSAFVTAMLNARIMKTMPSMDEGSVTLGSDIIAKEVTKEKALETEDLVQFYGPEIAPFIKKMRGRS